MSQEKKTTMPASRVEASRERITLPFLKTFRGVAALLALGCSGASPIAELTPRDLPLPTLGLSGQEVTIFPITLVAVSDSLDWESQLRPRQDALRQADSIINMMLEERSPEVIWVGPEALRAAHRQAPSMIADPDRLGTAILRSTSIDRLGDPLVSQVRGLVGVAGSRYALIPASLFFFAGDEAEGKAELTMAMVDARTGAVTWRNIASGQGDDPWQALTRALKTLNPSIP
jgi:hypothetical protein